MSSNTISTPVDIAVSGLRAQSLRMNVIAGNIANSGTSRTESGQPYRRKQVMLSAKADEAGGVTVDQVAEDTKTDFKRLYQPGNPDADKDGFVSMPNVDLPVEMVDLISPSRAYQANAATLKRYQEMVDVSMELLR